MGFAGFELPVKYARENVYLAVTGYSVDVRESSGEKDRVEMCPNLSVAWEKYGRT